VHFIDKENVGAGGAGDFGQHRLEPLLELAAIFGAGNKRAHVERQQFLVFQTLRHVAIDDAQSQALDDCGLADAGLADQHRIVLGAAGEHLHGAADFLVAADDWIKLAVARSLGEVTGIFFQRIISVLGGSRIRGAALAQSLDRDVERLRGDARILQNLCRLAALLDGQSQQQPLDGDETVARFLAGVFGSVEDACQSRVEIDLPCPAARDLRPLVELRIDGGERGARFAAGTVDQPRREPFGIVEQDLQQVFGGKLLMSLEMSGIIRRPDLVIAERTSPYP
jgi:hypothetical protein